MDQFEISNDRSRLNFDIIHGFLSTSYWCPNIPRELLGKSINNSLPFGAYLKSDRRQVGFGRVVTDYATFGYVADVFVLPEYRGHGIGKLLVKTMVEHPELKHLRRLLLATKDAHTLYQRFGFAPLASPSDFLTIHKPKIYSENQ